MPSAGFSTCPRPDHLRKIAQFKNSHDSSAPPRHATHTVTTVLPGGTPGTLVDYCGYYHDGLRFDDTVLL